MITEGNAIDQGRIIAYFDCEYAGLRLNGCALLRTRSDGLTVYPSKMEGPEAVRGSVTIVDSAPSDGGCPHRLSGHRRHRGRMDSERRAGRVGLRRHGHPLDPNHPWNSGKPTATTADA